MEADTGTFSGTCNEGISSVLEDLPYWSVPSGIDLLNTVQMRSNLRVLDTGSGSGCQLIELAQRLGNSSMVYGMERTEKAVRRIIRVSERLQLNNIEVLRGDTEELPFSDGYFDLVIFNAGIVNALDMNVSIKEVRRVCRSSAQLIVSVHLHNSMVEFYDEMEDVMQFLGLSREIKKMNSLKQSRQKSLQTVEQILRNNGFKLGEIRLNQFCMAFLDGTTFFRHGLIRSEFLPYWKLIFKEEDLEKVFGLLELRINQISEHSGGFRVTVPYAILNCRMEKR